MIRGGKRLNEWGLLYVSYRPYIAKGGLAVVVQITVCREYIIDVFMEGWIGRTGPIEKGCNVYEGMIKRECRVVIVGIYQTLEFLKAGKPPVIISVNFRID